MLEKKEGGAMTSQPKGWSQKDVNVVATNWGGMGEKNRKGDRRERASPAEKDTPTPKKKKQCGRLEKKTVWTRTGKGGEVSTSLKRDSKRSKTLVRFWTGLRQKKRGVTQGNCPGDGSTKSKFWVRGPLHKTRGRICEAGDRRNKVEGGGQ